MLSGAWREEVRSTLAVTESWTASESRPRVRAGGREVARSTLRAMAELDPLNRRVVEQMLKGAATRRYARSLEPVPATARGRWKLTGKPACFAYARDPHRERTIADRLVQRLEVLPQPGDRT